MFILFRQLLSRLCKNEHEGLGSFRSRTSMVLVLGLLIFHVCVTS